MVPWQCLRAPSGMQDAMAWDKIVGIKDGDNNANID